MADPQRLSINQITVKNWDLEQTAAGLARHGIGGIGLWVDKVEEVGLPRAVEIVRSHDLSVSSICRAGFFTEPTGNGAVSDDNRRAIEIAHETGADCLYIVCGGLGPDNDLRGARQRSQDGLAAMAEVARDAGVALALEPLHPMMAAERGVVVTLDQALDMAEAVGDDVGVAVDSYNVWWDPRLDAAIQRAGEKVISYQICDWLVPQPHPLFGRGIPGDGVIDLTALGASVDATGYSGPIEVEIFNEEVWASDPDDVLDAVAAGFARV
ncbi:sugar phosphate isomerase/epimerase family protein [Georgenia subflava]|uniref:TIM barrel protein n=1 Tax=Georgenia subflava TaxID=1622177 RepID=A0A6N7ENC5_9MICO|nr:sugar phosphate isomerase/epimerase family protein [Georgenia subflava]MPV38603.1 TIM barrel protein [Georgenia subflava]